LRAAFAIAFACVVAFACGVCNRDCFRLHHAFLAALSSLRACRGCVRASATCPFALGAWSLPGLALTIRWAGSAPLLRRGWTLKRAGPYYAGPPRSTARLALVGPSSSVPLLGAGFVYPLGRETVSATGEGACVPRRPALLRWARGLCRVWPLRYARPGPRRFCAGVGPCSGPALTTRGRHAQQLSWLSWARALPTRSWARGSSTRLARDRVSDRRECVRAPATCPFALGAWSLPGLALTVRWAGSAPLLRRGWTL